MSEVVDIWEELDRLQSRGSQSSKAGSLAGLHQKRQEHLSQFFTPAWLVRFIWETLQPAFNEQSIYGYSLLDNSIGAASMFRYADPDAYQLHGLDIDEELSARVSEILDESGYTINIVHAGMEQVELGFFSAAIINPPFSIPLASATLTPYEGVTHYGKHGPDTSALSHEYALAQALAHCDVVAAIVPASTTAKLDEFGDTKARLRAVYSLPSDTFQAENVQNVRTDLLIFGHKLHAPHSNAPEAIRVKRGSITRDSHPESLYQLFAQDNRQLGKQSINIVGVEASEPVVTLPPTDDKRVILNRAGRRIKLTFFDGATEGRVKNALFQWRLHSTRDHRYPKETKYSGQFQLNLDVLVLQDDPLQALDQVVRRIAEAGGVPIVNRDLHYGLKNLVKAHKKMTVPYGRCVYRKGTPQFQATANKMALLNRHQAGAVVAMGEEVSAVRTEHGFQVTTKRGQFECEHDHFFSLFEVEEKAVDADYWEQIHPPIKETFPQQIAQIEQRARELGFDQKLNWDYQFEDFCELAFRPNGAIIGWQMALGKSRLGLSLAEFLPGASLLVLKSRLVNEMEREIQELDLDPEVFHIIRGLSDLASLKKVNIISYELLRRPLDRRLPKITMARRLKKRIANVFADEGGLLANHDTHQSRALWQIGTKRRYILDGTPAPNYPREQLALVAWCFGQERSYQPYSMKRGYLSQDLFITAAGQPTGRQAFLDHYVCFEWATNEFLDSGHGAKREVPKIRTRNLGRFREWLNPVLKRRVQQEPAVKKHVTFPVPTLHEPICLEWDFEHLYSYYKTVEEFAYWYQDYAAEQKKNGRGLNLAMILARLEACDKAANLPSKVKGYTRPYLQLTSKERAVIEKIREQVALGRRPIVFARNPEVLNRMAVELDHLGITHLVFTGQENIDKRIQKLNECIREGDRQVLLASIGVTQDGLNLYQLDTFLFYDRSYKSREEFQAIYRLIRPQQKKDVYGFFFHLAGSIDEYKGQLIDWKTLASEAGLDYGEQPDDEEFTHFDAFIYRFLESLPDLRERLESYKKQKFA